MSDDQIDTYDPTDLASRDRRLGASILDGLILFGPILILPILLSSMSSGGRLLWLAGIMIVQLLMLGFLSQTLGKAIVGIVIVDAQEGTRPSAGQMFGRRVVLNGLFAIVPLYAFVDVLFIFRDDRRCIHDHLAGTVVVNSQPFEPFA